VTELPTLPELRPKAAPERSALVTGLVLGIATGLLVASVDAVRALTGPFGGSRVLHTLCIFGLLVPALGLAGALIAALFERALRLGTGDGLGASTLKSSVAALPFVAFAMWVPSGWIREHWAALPGKHRALAVVTLLVIGAGVLLGARVLYALWRRHASGKVGTPFLGAALALVALLAATTSWADAVLYEGDYEDFHYGLAGAFTGAMALGTVLASGLLPERWTPRPGRLVVRGVAVALTASFGLVLFAPTSAFSKSSSLVFTKLVNTGRSLTDLDGDGYAGVLGGSDCAQLDARVSPGGLEVPENGRDDDCSGKDAGWPPAPRPMRKRASDARPNVVLITIDALRADHVGVYGYKRLTSPNIDRLAARSLVFTDAYSQAPKTTDSVPSIMTGAYPSNVPREFTDTGAKRRKEGGYELSEDARPLAVLFKASGYATAAGTGFGLDQVERGFETFETRQPTQTALRFLETTNVPFFLWLHYAEPHIPYVRHKEHDFGSSPMDRYDGEIAAADAQVGKVLRALEEHELAKTTIVILTADHGEEFLEHGGTSHTRKLYRELLHVPLIIHVPGTPARRIKGPVELVDIAPTLAELTGIELADGSFDGESLLADERQKDAVAYAEDLRRGKTGELDKRMLFNGRYRLIDDRVADRLELYDDKKDPREQRDLALKRPDLVARLREALSVHAFRRHTEPMKKLSERADAATWAALLPTFRRPEVLGAALDRFPKARSPERDAVLTKLLARRNLDERVAAKARALSAN
jgi:arylsulfatase A-like enzyme